MKKTLLKVTGAVVAASAMLLVACSQPTVVDPSKIEKVGAPSVKGVAYPGVNYVYWSASANDGNYVVEKYVNGVKASISASGNTIIDTEISNGESIEYKVRAKGNSRTADVTYQDSDWATVTLKAIVPDYATKPSDFALYEKGYEVGKEYKLSDEEAKRVITADNIKLIQDASTVRVTFPAKAYLKYGVAAKSVTDNSVGTLLDKDVVPATNTWDLASTNNVDNVYLGITAPGEYNVKVVVAAYDNAKYITKDVIVASEKVTYEALDGVANQATPTAKWTDAENVTLTWAPATYNSAKAPATMYKVYRSNAGSDAYTAVEGDVAVVLDPTTGNVKYQISDKVDGTKAYKYTVVVTDGKNIAPGAQSVVTTYVAGTLSLNGGSFSYTWLDKENLVFSIVPGYVDGAPVAASMYKLYKKAVADEAYTLVETEVKDVTDPTTPYSYKYSVGDKVADATKAYDYKLVVVDGDKIGQAGYANSVRYTSVGVDGYGNDSYAYAYFNKWIDAETAEIAISAGKINKVVTPASMFKVYRKEVGSTDAYVEVAATIAPKANVTTPVVDTYYFTTKVESGKCYMYRVVITDGSKLNTVGDLEVNNSVNNYVSESALNASYIDKNTVRVTLPDAVALNGKYDGNSYKVYRKTSYEDDDKYVEVTADIKSYTNSGSTQPIYFLDDTIVDTSINYVYLSIHTVPVLEGKPVVRKATCYVWSYDSTEYTEARIAGIVSTNANDVDSIANDVKWSITGISKDQTVKAYIYTVANTVKPQYGSFSPNYADFDISEGKEMALVNEGADDDTVYFYTNNLPAGRTFVLVITSEKDKKDVYRICGPVNINELDEPNDWSVRFSVKVYDDTVTSVNQPMPRVNNDVIINVTDDIYVLNTSTGAIKDDISNYTYTLYKSVTPVAIKYINYYGYENSISVPASDWTKVTDLEMKADTEYTAVQNNNMVRYVAVYKENDLADGYYTYKLVKTNKAGKSVNCGTEGIDVDTTSNVAMASNVSITDVESIDATAQSDTRKYKLTVEVAGDPKAVYGKDVLSGYVVGWEAFESDMTVTLYKKTSNTINGGEWFTESVYTKVADLTGAELTKGTYYSNVYNATTKEVETKVPGTEYVTNMKFTYTDTAVNGTDAYDYIVVVSKAGKIITSSIYAVSGAY